MNDLVQYRKDDIDSEFFDIYLSERLAKITPEQKSQLPEHLVFKIFRGEQYAIKSLTFLQKLKVLLFGFGTRMTILLEDPGLGLTWEQFARLDRNFRSTEPRRNVVDDFRISGTFVLGGYDLVSRMEYANYMCASNLYRLAKDYKTFPNVESRKTIKAREAKDNAREITKMLLHYEASKKKITMNYNLPQPQWYALLFFYENESKSAPFLELFRYGYNANQSELRRALVELQHKGLMEKRGKGSHFTLYFLTPKGKAMLSQIFANIVLQY